MLFCVPLTLYLVTLSLSLLSINILKQYTVIIIGKHLTSQLKQLQ